MNKLEEKLCNIKKHGYININEKYINDYAKEYMEFLNESKTERLFIKNSIKFLEKKGFTDINKVNDLKPNSKVYFNNKDKNIFISVIGSEDVKKGTNIIAAHVDSPRLDLKSNPLYEDNEFAYMKTDYYGGIKKYQWTCIPLSMHGVVVLPNGDKIDINIGEKEADPIFTITDLLPHLAKDQMAKKLSDGISGEDLNILVGSRPIDIKDAKNKVKLNILNILNEKYGITEIDFTSSEIELVPAFNARETGFDKSMIASYGQDDRVCAYASLKAISEIDKPKTTAVAVLTDKEEIGSIGNTGLESKIFDFFMKKIVKEIDLDEVYFNSKVLSSDVEAGYDPNFASVSEKYNSGHLNYGITIVKYTGGRGKSGGSDANAEYIAYIRNIMEENNIKYQFTKLGKSEVGGGGTVAYILANKGAEVIDCGVSVLSMHAPYEVTSKFDIHELYRFNKVFYEK